MSESFYVKSGIDLQFFSLFQYALASILYKNQGTVMALVHPFRSIAHPYSKVAPSPRNRCRDLSPPPTCAKKIVSKTCMNKKLMINTVKVLASTSLTYFLPNVVPTILLTGVCVGSFVQMVRTSRAPMSSETFRSIFKGAALGFILKSVRFLATGHSEVPLALAAMPLTKIFHAILTAIELPTYPICALSFHRLST